MKKLIFATISLLISLLLAGCTAQEPSPEPVEPPAQDAPAEEEHVHSFGSWKVTKATCLKNGKKVRACACGESETVTLPATGHKSSDWIIDNEPTCLAAGEQYKKCTACNTELARESVDSLGHDFVSTRVFPDVELEGYTMHVCARCAYSYDDGFVPAWGRVQFLYTVNKDGVTCTIMDVVLNESTELHIPDTIEDDFSEYRVTAIGAHALEGCDTLTVIRIPEGVTSLGDYSFAGCSSLSEIVIPNGVVSIGDHAFDGCSVLPSVDIPETVAEIGKAAFKDCRFLTEVTLPEAVTEISDELFSGCLALTDVTFGSVSSVGDGAFVNCGFLSEISSLETVAEIGDRAFADCVHLTSLILGEPLTRIGYGAFINTPELARVDIPNIEMWFGLEILSGDANPLSGSAVLYVNDAEVTEVVFPETVDTVGAYLFFGYDKLERITVPNTVTSVGEAAFSCCTALSSAELCADIERLPANLFNGCTSLAALTLPEKLTHVGLNAFAGCSALSELVLPESVYYISAGAFAGCRSLSEMLVPNGVSVIFEETFYNCIGLVKITLPASLVCIERSAFEGCAVLSELVLPENIERIGDRAFTDCSGLLEIRIPASLTRLGYGAFTGCTATQKVFVDDLESWCAIDFADIEANPLSVSKIELDEEGFVKKEAARLYVGGFLMADLILDADITVISDYAFWHCEGISSLCFYGTAEEFYNLSVIYNPFISEMREQNKVYFYSASKPESAGSFWYYNSFGYVCKW